MKIKNMTNGLLFLILCLIHFNVTAADTAKTVVTRISLDEFSYGNIYGGAGFMITSTNGTSIVTDPYDVVEGVKADIITVSHSHFDHEDSKFIDRMKNSQISLYTIEAFSVNKVKVHGIAASHGRYGIDQKKPDNVIYTFEVDGLRIAHMGDIGQDGLTKDQLEELGNVDIVFMNFVNGFGMSISSSLKTLKQINPKILIPTHLEKEGFAQLHNIYNRFEYQNVRWAVDRNYLNNLGDDRIVLFLIPKNGSIVEQWDKTFISK